MQKVVHPFILPIKFQFPADNNEWGDRLHTVVTEWREGATLQDKLAQQGGTPMTEGDAVRIFIMVTLAVEQAHHEDRPHARISSANVFYSSSQSIQLCPPANLKQHIWRKWVENFYLAPELQGNNSSDSWIFSKFRKE